MTGDKVPDHLSSHQPADKATQEPASLPAQPADQTTPYYHSAEARQIFVKIEKLAFDAIREELKDDVDAIIDNFMEEGEQAHKEQSAPSKPAKAPTTPHPLQDLAQIKAEDYDILRDLISSQVQEVLEEEAPAIVRRILASALLPPEKHP